jgi:hypothetical protein
MTRRKEKLHPLAIESLLERTRHSQRPLLWERLGLRIRCLASSEIPLNSIFTKVIGIEKPGTSSVWKYIDLDEARENEVLGGLK